MHALRRLGRALAPFGIAGALLLGAGGATVLEKYHAIPYKSANYVEVSCFGNGEYKIETPTLTVNQYAFGRRPVTEPMYGEGVGITALHLATDANGRLYEDYSYAGNGTVICPDIVLTAEHVLGGNDTYYFSGQGDGMRVLFSGKDDREHDLALLFVRNEYPFESKTRIRTSKMEEGERVFGVAVSAEDDTGIVSPFTRTFKHKGGPMYHVEEQRYNESGKGVDTYSRLEEYDVVKNPDGSLGVGAIKQKNPATERGWSGSSFYDRYGNLAGMIVSSDLSTGIRFARTPDGETAYQIGKDYAVPAGEIIAFLRGE